MSSEASEYKRPTDKQPDLAAALLKAANELNAFTGKAVVMAWSVQLLMLMSRASAVTTDSATNAVALQFAAKEDAEVFARVVELARAK